MDTRVDRSMDGFVDGCMHECMAGLVDRVVVLE